MFKISPEQIKSIKRWMSEREKENSKPYGAIGGRFSYCFMPTGVGVILIVKDDLTNKQIDVTSYEDW